MGCGAKRALESSSIRKEGHMRVCLAGQQWFCVRSVFLGARWRSTTTTTSAVWQFSYFTLPYYAVMGRHWSYLMDVLSGGPWLMGPSHQVCARLANYWKLADVDTYLTTM